MTYVSDHAVLRYLERVRGVDVEAIRAELASPIVAQAAAFGCDTVQRHDCRLKLHGDVVATVVVKRGKR